MKEFFVILFFGRAVALTPDPISFSGTLSLTPDDPLVAVNAGASLRIDLSTTVDGVGLKAAGIKESMARLENRFPEDCVEAVLYSKDSQVHLKQGFGLYDYAAILILRAAAGVPTDTEYEKVEISSCTDLEDVEVTWQNYTG